MCTENEDFQLSNSTSIIKNESLADSKFCLKCKINFPIVFLRSDGVYCRDCFVSRTAHKFRLEFGKSHLIRDNEKVLVYIKHCRYSLTLLHLINEGISKRAKKKLRFVPLCVFIIDEDDTKCIEDIKSIYIDPINKYELPICIYDINQLYKEEIKPLFSNIELKHCTSYVHITSSTSIEQLSSSLKNKTSLTTLKNILRKELLVRIARDLDITKIIVSDNSNQLASNLILNIIEGRGSQITHEMAFVDKRNEDVLFVRPLKNFTDEEITAWNNIHENKLPDTVQNLGKSNTNSMQNLTETFLTSLQKENENTLSIVCRIGEKFTQSNETSINCLICKSPFVEKPTSSNSNISVSVPNVLCSTGSCRDQSKVSNNLTTCCQNASKHSFISKEKMSYHCCYGCKILINDMDIDKLPNYIINDFQKLENRSNLRDIVEDYLLDDN